MGNQAIVASLDDLHRELGRHTELAERQLELQCDRIEAEKAAAAAFVPEQDKNRRLLLVAHALGGLLASGERGHEVVRGAVEYADFAVELLEAE
jgi:uncharacterized protein YigA (DUF484 family)